MEPRPQHQWDTASDSDYFQIPSNYHFDFSRLWRLGTPQGCRNSQSSQYFEAINCYRESPPLDWWLANSAEDPFSRCDAQRKSASARRGFSRPDSGSKTWSATSTAVLNSDWACPSGQALWRDATKPLRVLALSVDDPSPERQPVEVGITTSNASHNRS